MKKATKADEVKALAGMAVLVILAYAVVKALLSAMA